MNKLLKLFMTFLVLATFANAQLAWKGYIARSNPAEVNAAEALAVSVFADGIEGMSAAEANNLYDYAQAPGADELALLTAAEVGYSDGASIANDVASKNVVLNAAGDIVAVNGDTLSSATGVAGVTIVSGLNISTITLTNYSMVITDSEGSGGHGVLKIIDFPEGMIYVLGVIGDMSIASQTGSADNAVFDMALGDATTLTDAETLANANVNFVAKVDGTLSSGIDTIDLITNTPQTEDGHTTATDVFLCVAIADTHMSATGTMVMSGTIVVTWVNTGDY